MANGNGKINSLIRIGKKKKRLTDKPFMQQQKDQEVSSFDPRQMIKHLVIFNIRGTSTIPTYESKSCEGIN